MSTRSRSRSVTFRRPFFLTGFEAEQAAGTYVINVEEEAIEDVSFPAFRRVSTQMQVPSLGATEHRLINPAELDEALAQDALEQAPQTGSVSSRPAPEKRELAQKVKTRLVRRY
jgi:hypothetical protein